MSIPTLAQGPVGALAVPPLDAMLASINSNPYFIGTMMLFLNLGGRFISMEMSKGQEQFFQNPWVRRFLIFTVLFMGTRNVLIAFWMTLIIVLIIGYLFNENSSLCLFHLGQPGSSCAEGVVPTASQMQAQMTPATPFTPEEAEIYRRLTEKQQKFAADQRKETTRTPAEFPKSLQDVYWQNMTLLKGFETFKDANPRF